MDTDSHGSESELTEAVTGAAFEVANVPGAGFLEKVYELALIRELALHDMSAKAQVSFPVCYQGQYVGEYVADLAQCIKLPQSISSSRGPAHQFSEAQGGMEARSPGPIV
jgi:hypothetical protein